MTPLDETDLHHPSESVLADLMLGGLDEARSSSVAEHLRACPPCRILFDRLSQGLPELPIGDLAGDPAAVPEAALGAIAAADRPDAGPRQGELWRARRRPGDPVILVLVRVLGPAGPAVVAVSLDTELADDHTLIVPAVSSPLGTPLAVHLAIEATVDARCLLDRLGSVDVDLDHGLVEVDADLAEAAESVHTAQDEGERERGSSMGPAIVSPLDERIEYRQALADHLAELAVAPGGQVPEAPRRGAWRDAAEQPDWWPLAGGSVRVALLVALHEVLAPTHGRARVTPRPAEAAGTEQLSAVALVAELDAFVLVASVAAELDERALLEAAQLTLQADQLLNAVCVAELVAPYMSVVIDRRDVVEAIETPSGRLRPPRQSRPPAPIGDALVKFLDATITPFGRLASTVVEGEAIDPRQLAVDVSADAVLTVAGAARGYKVEGKRPGYERVTRHQASIVRLVESALDDPDVDVASILEMDE
jgi:hypothetical protein